MKRVFSVFLIVCTCVHLAACGLFGMQSYKCNENDVESIEIVSIDAYPEQPGEMYKYSVVGNVTEISEFVTRLNSMDFSKNWGDPTVMKEGYNVIKINYFNGACDLIHYRAQRFFTADGQVSTGYFFFDKEQYTELIKRYNSTD